MPGLMEGKVAVVTGAGGGHHQGDFSAYSAACAGYDRDFAFHHAWHFFPYLVVTGGR